MLFCSVWVPVQRLVAADFMGFDFTSERGHWRTQICWGGWNSPPQSRASEARTEQVRISSQEKYTHDEEVGVGRSSLR